MQAAAMAATARPAAGAATGAATGAASGHHWPSIGSKDFDMAGAAFARSFDRLIA